AFPIVRTCINHHTLHRSRAIVAFLPGSFATVIFRNNRAASIWIEEDFRGVEAHSIRGIEWSFNSIGINLPGCHARHEYVPVVIRAVAYGTHTDDTRGTSIIDTIEKEQVDRRCML